MARRTSSPPAHPRRDAAATRAAILDAARRHFARVGYDHVGVREIAADAGVTGALVNRYFGSKERLFAEVLAGGFQIAPLLPEERTRLGEALAAAIATGKGRSRRGSEPLLLLLRSVTNPTAAELLRARVDEQLIAPLAEWIGGEEAELRAALVVSCLMGLSVVRRVLRSHAFDGADDATLTALLAPVLDACVNGAPGRALPSVRRATNPENRT